MSPLGVLEKITVVRLKLRNFYYTRWRVLLLCRSLHQRAPRLHEELRPLSQG